MLFEAQMMGSTYTCNQIKVRLTGLLFLLSILSEVLRLVTINFWNVPSFVRTIRYEHEGIKYFLPFSSWHLTATLSLAQLIQKYFFNDNNSFQSSSSFYYTEYMPSIPLHLPFYGCFLQSLNTDGQEHLAGSLPSKRNTKVYLQHSSGVHEVPWLPSRFSFTSHAKLGILKWN